MAYSENFYSGGYSSLDPETNFVGYRIPVSELAPNTDARTANQVKAASNVLNTGAKTFEITQVLSPDIFESIPEQYFDELNKLTKITGTKASLHAPVIDPSGFTQQGWNENNREVVTRQFTDVLRKAHKIDPKGNIPVVFHSTSLPGTEYSYDKKTKELVPEQMVGVDVETGQLNKFKREEIYQLGREKDIWTPEERMDNHNVSQWKNSILGLNYNKKEADELLHEALSKLGPDTYKKIISGKITQEEIKKSPERQQGYFELQKAEGMLQHIESQINNVYEDAVKYNKASAYLSKEIAKDHEEKARKILKEMGDEWTEYVNDYQEARVKKEVGKQDIAKKSELIDSALSKMNYLTSIGVVPQKIIPLDEFAKKQASETFSSAAFKSYKDFGNNAPIIAIENPPAGGAISTGSQLKELVEETRKKFVEKAVKEGIGKGEAESAAKKLIGATWDVGHINMLRKYGADSDYLVKKETEKIAPFVKHVHLSDNFGFEHTELPMGMGNVPVKEMLERLGKEGFEGKKVIEAFNWFQHFSEQGKFHPLQPTLEAFGSPIYGMAMSPYWNQAAGTVGGYSAGFGTMLPDQHFSMYGAGFEQLPVELGGQVQGKRDRFGGAPMD